MSNIGDNTFTEGSKWRKWDLHVHTPASFFWNGGKLLRDMSYKEKEVSIETFIKKVNDSDIATFCIMDYWTFDWCIELKKYTKEHPDKLRTMIFSGMELRVECPVNYRLNIHVLLSNLLSVQQLQDFKSNLRIRIGNKNKILSDEALIEFAKSLSQDKAQIHGFKNPNTLTDDQLLKLGSQTAKVTNDSLQVAFKQIPEDSGFVILPYDTSDGLLNLDWKKHPHDDNYFMQTASIFETRDQRNIDLFNGIKTKENEEFFINFYKTIGSKAKPCISGSDAHRFSEYGNYPTNRITWIKADPTFEGLKRVISEPIERVYIGAIPPKLQDVSQYSSKYIKSISVGAMTQGTTPAWFDNQIELNTGLIAIIGRKGSGKSALADIIALLGKSYIDSKDYSFLIGDKFRKPGIASRYQSSIYWCDDNKLEDFNLNDNVNRSTEPERVRYLPQVYVDRLCNEVGVSDKFQKEINKVVFSYLPKNEL